MSKLRGGIEHTVVSTNSAIMTSRCIYYGCVVNNATTGGVQVLLYDAKATAQGNLTDIITTVAGTNSNNGTWFNCGIHMHSGIYVSAPVCTTASDSIIVYYGGV
jgi:hypothetical protein